MQVDESTNYYNVLLPGAYFANNAPLLQITSSVKTAVATITTDNVSL